MRKSFRINTYLRGRRVSVASKEVGGNRSGQQNHISLPANAFSQGMSYAGTMSQERDDLVSLKRKKAARDLPLFQFHKTTWKLL